MADENSNGTDLPEQNDERAEHSMEPISPQANEQLVLDDNRVAHTDIQKEMRQSYLDYAISVIVERALPDVRDGMKPVHRRILYAMNESGIYPNRPHKKSAWTVGEVIGKYHPHGDFAVYEAMVRLAQWFSMRTPLIDGHGNFGNIDGDGAAAMRYTESRLAKPAMELLRDLQKDTVDWQPNYDESLAEPVALPARFPNLLVNGSQGIAVGMATNIAPHNLTEAIEATCYLIDNPEATVDELMQIMPGPDFPTGAIIMGSAGIKQSYETGRGSITVRAKAHVESTKTGRSRLVFTEIPYMVNKGTLQEKIAQLVNDGFSNTIPVLDNKEELELFEDSFTKKCKVGIRIACEEEPKFEFYTSRLGIRYNDIIDFYKAKLKNSKKFQLKMLHFFINTGIKDTAYYWNELSKCINVYCELKAICPELDSLNIGGGFPIKNSLNFEYDYEYLTEEIIAQIKNICQRNDTEEPNIFTEFGSFTVGESGASLYSIVNQKQQNDRENWYMIDSSFITTLPDTWGINQRYIMLAVNNWDKEYQRVLLGGLTCDSEDFYNAESHTNAIFLPKLEPGNTQYIGFFHTGAYQESIGGFGGIQHCLIPAPKHVIIDRDKDDNEYYTRLFTKEQSYRSMLRILGY